MQLRHIRVFQHFKLEPYWTRSQCGIRTKEDHKHVFLGTEDGMMRNINMCNAVVTYLQLV